MIECQTVLYFQIVNNLLPDYLLLEKFSASKIHFESIKKYNMVKNNKKIYKY